MRCPLMHGLPKQTLGSMLIRSSTSSRFMIAPFPNGAGFSAPTLLFTVGIVPEARERARPHGSHPPRRQVVADVLQDHPFLGPLAGQFDQGLEQLEEQGVIAEPS